MQENSSNIKTILIIEDDMFIGEMYVSSLKKAGYDVEWVTTGTTGYSMAIARQYDLILLDIMLPEVDGLEILRVLRDQESTRYLPVIMLTAKGTEYDTVCGLDAGADDYLAKPFGMMELISRINALQRRAFRSGSERDEEVLDCGDIRISITEHTVLVGGEEVALTLKEFDLLCMLVRNKEQVFSRSKLLEEVWGMSFAGNTRTVDVHIQTLRQKLADAHPGADEYIQTVRGIGYCVKEFRKA